LKKTFPVTATSRAPLRTFIRSSPHESWITLFVIVAFRGWPGISRAQIATPFHTVFRISRLLTVR